MEEKILNLLRFIVITANRAGYSKVWTVHLIKYLYIADYFEAKNHQKVITDIDWKFWNLGPWNPNCLDYIESAAAKGFISSGKGFSKFTTPDKAEDDTWTFFFSDEELTDNEYDKLGLKVLPNIRTRMNLEGIIKQYGCKTNPLLNYVYSRTEPMQGIVKGEDISFEELFNKASLEIKKPNPIKRKKIKKAEEILKSIKELKKPDYFPPQGKIDDLYIRSMERADSQDFPSDEDIPEAIACIKNISLTN